MEIARLEVSTQQHLERMQETAKVNYVQYGKSTKNKGKKSAQSGTSGGNCKSDRGHGTSSKPGRKGRKLPFPQDTCYRCGKGRHQRNQDCKALDVVCRGCGKKGYFQKVCLKAKHSTDSLEVPQISTSSTGASEPLYFNDGGQPVFAHMVSVLHASANKHLIKFPIALDYEELKIGSRNKMENSTDSTGHSKLSTVLLKADTGADVNLMNKQIFDQLFKDNSLLQLTPIRMENYGNSAVKVLGKFHAFLKWKDNVYRQLFYVRNCDRSPNLLSCDTYYTLGVLKPCYTVEMALTVSRTSTDSTNPTKSQVRPTQVGNHFFIMK